MKILFRTCIVASVLTLAFAQTSWKAMPGSALKGSDGKGYSAMSLRNQGTILVFFSDGCPHNKKAIPELVEFAKSLKGSVKLIGVVDADLAGAKKLATDNKANFPILADPTKVWIKAAGAKNSLDMAVVTSTGNANPMISSRWQGLSQKNMADAIKAIKSKGIATGNPLLSAIGTKLQSGCGI